MFMHDLIWIWVWKHLNGCLWIKIWIWIQEHGVLNLGTRLPYPGLEFALPLWNLCLIVMFYFHRWAQLRTALVPVTAFLEPISECFVAGILVSWAIYYITAFSPLIVLTLHLITWLILDYILLWVIQVSVLSSP